MKTGQLFQFDVEKLSEALQVAFGDKARKDFDDAEEVQCTGCLHKNSRLYVVAETERHALRSINEKKMGLCGDCIADLIAKERWQVVTKGDRF